MNWKKFLWIQKEGIILGGLWGIIAPFGGLGMATLPSIPWYYKLLILPTWLSSFIPVSGRSAFIVSIIIGGTIGIIIDCLYKPNE